jgi:hypothetical protein
LNQFRLCYSNLKNGCLDTHYLVIKDLGSRYHSICKSACQYSADNLPMPMKDEGFLNQSIKKQPHLILKELN